VIKRIDYTNIELTKIQVVEREMPFSFGDSLMDAESVFFEFENRIVSLGLFTGVDLQMINDTTLRIRALEKVYFWGLPKVSLADPNFSQWLGDKDFSRIAIGADLFAKNIKGLKNQLTVSALVGFNSSGSITYEKVPQGTNWDMGFNIKLGAGFRSQQKTGVSDDTLVWDNRDNPHLNLRSIKAGLNWRKGLYSLFDVHVENERVFSSPRLGSANAFSLEDSLIKQYSMGLGFTLDKRVQQHFPVGGSFIKATIDLFHVLGNKNSWTYPEINLKANKYYSLNKKWLLKGGVAFNYQAERAPFYYSSGLGLNRNYIRGYEPYSFVSKGFALGKISLAYALRNGNKVKLTNKNWFGNYGTMPFSLWCSIFVENGKLINPVTIGNSMAKENLYSIGISLQALAYYNSTIRMDVAINRLNNVVGNVSFRNAF